MTGRRQRWTCAAILSAGILSAAGCGFRTSSTPTPPRLTATSLGWTRNVNGRFMDEWGRQVLLRGSSAKVDGLFDCSFPDGRIPTEIVPVFDETDARNMVYMGFNFIRLAVTWSGLEPTEGTFNPHFLETLDRVIDIGRQTGIYILIDFHEDAYSKEIGEDGAPLWAIIPPPPQLLQGPLFDGPGYICDGITVVCQDLNARRLAGPTIAAFTSFFKNTDGIQDRFMPAWRLLAERYKDTPVVIGFEDMNEPVARQLAEEGYALLEAFHRNAAVNLRKVNSRHALWIEPEVVTRNLTATAPLRKYPFPDDNVVYAPHLYEYLAGISGSNYEEWYSVLQGTFDSLIREAASWNAAPVIGEWGAEMQHPSGADHIDAFQDVANERNVGLAIWSWKGYGTQSTGYSGAMYRWDFPQEKWIRNDVGNDTLSRPYPMAVPGTLEYHRFDKLTNSLVVFFRAHGGEGAPLLYLPIHRYPRGYILEMDGRPVVADREAMTQRVLLPWDGTAGVHSITLRPAP